MISFRKTTAEDSSTLLALKIKTIPVCSSHYSDEDISKWLKFCKKEDPISCFSESNGYLAIKDNEPIGFVTYTKGRQKSSIDNLFIPQENMGNKVGETLLHLAEEQIHDDNKEAVISIRSTINAKMFYEKYGYKYVEDSIARAGFLIYLLRK